MPTPARRIRVVIADDEPLARSTLRRLLAAERDVELVAECSDGARALDAITELAPDLVFLDVHMPVLDGFEVIERVGARAAPLVVFVTAYDRYAIRAFDAHAVDYLLKPFDDARFHEALAAARRRLELERAAETAGRIAALIDEVRGARAEREPAQRDAERLAIRSGGGVELVDLAEIEWIEAADQYVIVHTRNGEHLMRESLSELERRLDPARFVRVHRSAIVALARVRKLERNDSGTGRVLVGESTWLPVSRTRVALLAQSLG